MKKLLAVVAAVAVALAITGCSSTDLTSAKVGWANYAEITVKDFDSVGIVRVESSEEVKVSPFMLNRTTKGGKVTYGDLMQEAKKIGADDIINVRIDQRDESSFSPLQFLSGWTSKTSYVGTALAIKYKTVQANVKIDANDKTVSLQGGAGALSLSSLLPF